MSRSAVFWLAALLAVAAAAAQAYWLRWTCDDAYISFRYAAHFVEGWGLVYNRDPAEAPVEGYTNFAWTMWLAFGMWLGCTGDAIETWSNFWGIACHAATVLWLACFAYRASGGRALLPLAAIGYASLHHAASLAPAGLETALFVLLTTGILWQLLWWRCFRDCLQMGLLGVLLAMTRPDGALLVGVAGAFLLVDCWPRRHWLPLLAYAAPFVLLFLPYLLWRHSYYGYWVPNTFYAKSAADPYPGQGLRYVVEFFRCYWGLVPLLPLACIMVWRRPDPLAAIAPQWGRRAFLVVLGGSLPYLGFVIWVGGDFMFGRFLLPLLPALLLAADFTCLRLRSAHWQWLAAAVLVAGGCWRNEPEWLRKHPNPLGISDNRAVSVAEFVPGITYIEAMRFAGHFLHGVFADLDVRFAIVGSHANLAYRTMVPVVVECSTGLTDARIAHTPIAVRGTIGHEKGYRSHHRYLTHERGVQFTFDLDYRAGDLTDAWRDLVFPVIPAKLLRYDRWLIAELRQRNPHIQVVDLAAELDAYLAELPQKQRGEVARDYQALCAFYFDHNEDPQRQQVFIDYLR